MKFNIENFKVVKTFVSKNNKSLLHRLWHWIIGKSDKVKYHYDVKFATEANLTRHSVILLEGGVKFVVTNTCIVVEPGLSLVSAITMTLLDHPFEEGYCPSYGCVVSMPAKEG